MENLDVQMTAFETRLQSLKDVDLVNQVQSLFQREKRIGDAILLGLKEIKARRLFAAMGYPSLFEFLVKHFGLSESATYQRLQALKLIEAVPEVQGDLFSGALSLSGVHSAQKSRLGFFFFAAVGTGGNSISQWSSFSILNSRPQEYLKMIDELINKIYLKW